MEPGYAIIAALAAMLVHGYVDTALWATGNTRVHRLARRRARRAELAAIEASDEEPAFDPEHIEAEIEHTLALVDRAWATGEDTTTGRRDQRELQRWAQEMQAMCPYPKLRGLQETRLVHVVNREGDVEDRVDVWVRIRLGPRTGWRIDRLLGIRSFDQHWTLGRRGDHWDLLRFDHKPVSGRVLKRRLIPMPWTDHERLHGESLRELAAAEPQAVGLSDRYRDAAVRARDLSLVDARYSEPVIESVLTRLLEAWEQAALGRPQRLRHLASQRAGDSLRRKPARAGLDLAEWHVALLDDRREPVRMSIDLSLTNGEGMRWVLESCEGSDPLWRLVGARA